DFRFNRFRGKIEPIRGFFAGYFMAVRKSTWKKYPFPLVGSQGGRFLGIDSTWARTLREGRVKVGMLWGLMVVHFYRLDKGETDLTHLNDPGHNQKIPNHWDLIARRKLCGGGLMPL